MGGVFVAALMLFGLGVSAHATESGHWTAQRNGPRPPQGVTSLSCPRLDSCTTVTDTGATLHYDGTAWGSVGTASHDLGPLDSVSCPTPSFCAAVGGHLAAVKKDGQWGRPFVTHGDAVSVSCPSAHWCLAVGRAGQTWIYDGTHWHQGLRTAPYLSAVSCASAKFCFAMTDPAQIHQRFLEWNGVSWHGSTPGGQWQTLSCGSPTLCVAASGTAALRWTGHGWVRHAFADWQPYHDVRVDCGTDFCQLLAPHQAAEYHDGWGRITDASGVVGSPVALSCPSRGHCVAVTRDDADHERAATSAGVTWNTTAYPDPVDVVDHLSCPTATFCMGGMSGGGATRMLRDGAWTSADLPAGWSGDTRVSCTSPAFCMASTLAGSVATWDGSAWSSAASLEGAGALVDCITASDCVAATVDASWTWNGSVWAAGPAPAVQDGAEVTSLSCPETGDCWLGTDEAEIDHLVGSAWSVSRSGGQLDVNDDMFVACGSTTMCAAGDQSGEVFTWTGHGWTSGGDFGQVAALACASADSCTAALAAPAGRVARWDGSSWTVSRALPRGYASYQVWPDPPALSCPTDQVCFLADSTGNTWMRN